MDTGFSHVSLLALLKNVAWHIGVIPKVYQRDLCVTAFKLNENLYSHFIQQTDRLFLQNF